MKILIKYLVIGSLLIAGFSCSDDEKKTCTKEISQAKLDAVNQAQLATDVTAIDLYLENNSITAVEDPTGLRYVVHQMGDGKEVCLESKLVLTYAGRLMSNNDTFDDSTEPVQFQLSNLILGWQIGFLKFPVGTSVTLYIPSGLAYGASKIKDGNGNTIIPANANLIFDVELIDVK